MRFSVGVNYWPRRQAMQMWQRFDAGAIADDLAQIAELGLGGVRIFLRWSDFQPEPDRVDTMMLLRLEEFMDLTAAAGLRALPTLFSGHLCGVNWLPGWALDAWRPAGRVRTVTASGSLAPFGCGDLYRGALLAAQRLHAREAAVALRGHPALVAWDLGSDFGTLREPAAPEAAREWSKRLTDDLERAGDCRVTGGLHVEDLVRDRRIRPSSTAEPWTFATLHGFPAPPGAARGGADPAFVPYLAQLAASLACKPVLAGALGQPAGLDEADVAAYATAVLDRLQRDGRLGAFWWCWSDYDDALAGTPPFDEAPHELRFGIVRADGSHKPVAGALSAFAREARPVVEATDAVLFEPAYYAGLPRTMHDAYARFLEFHL